MSDAPYRPEDEGPLASPEEMATEASSGAPAFIAVQAPFATPEKLQRARELVRSLAVAHTNAALYPTSHPLVAGSLDELASAVRSLAEFGFESVTINIYKNTLFVENQVFPEESVTYAKLIEEILARGISAITFSHGVTVEEAAGLIELLADPRVTDIEAARGIPGRPQGRRHRGGRDHHPGRCQHRGAQPRGPSPSPRELRPRRHRRCARSRHRPSSVG